MRVLLVAGSVVLTGLALAPGGHVGALATAPGAWAQRVAGFLDANLSERRGAVP